MNRFLSRISSVSGFGQAVGSDGYVFTPESVDEIREVLRVAKGIGRPITLRGAGRSYGDAASGREGIVLDLSFFNKVLEWNPATGRIKCEAGVTLEQLWRHCLADGWWPPVVTGTMKPTLGGTLAMNVHGKNNFCQGTLGEHVASIEVLFANGELRTLANTDALFTKIVSSAGLLGVILSVELLMHKVASSFLEVQAISCSNWDEQLEQFRVHAEASDYMVAWVDCFGAGSSSGRGLFHAARYCTEPDPDSLDPSALDLPTKVLRVFPKDQLWRILKQFNNRAGMMLINRLKHWASSGQHGKKLHRQSLVEFSFLLDYVPGWLRAYAPGGFIQFQCFVPDGRAAAVFRTLTQLQQSERLEAFLGVLKRHRRDTFMFTHAVDGFSLALDFKVSAANRSRLWAMCHQMNEVVLSAGGKFYFAKDATLRPEDASAFLGNALSEYRDLKMQLDPDRLFTSDLATRLRL